MQSSAKTGSAPIGTLVDAVIRDRLRNLPVTPKGAPCAVLSCRNKPTVRLFSNRLCVGWNLCEAHQAEYALKGFAAWLADPKYERERSLALNASASASGPAKRRPA